MAWALPCGPREVWLGRVTPWLVRVTRIGALDPILSRLLDEPDIDDRVAELEDDWPAMEGAPEQVWSADVEVELSPTDLFGRLLGPPLALGVWVLPPSEVWEARARLHRWLGSEERLAQALAAQPPQPPSGWWEHFDPGLVAEEVWERLERYPSAADQVAEPRRDRSDDLAILLALARHGLAVVGDGGLLLDLS